MPGAKCGRMDATKVTRGSERAGNDSARGTLRADSLELEELGLLAVDAKEADDLRDCDDDAHRAKQVRPPGRDRDRDDWGDWSALSMVQRGGEDALFGAAKASTPVTRETTRNWARIA
mgnify:CR=1 FL=1